ncbi:Carrier domain-containing protein [Candidatus Magnetomoraceae bacterium gMMP-1]
MQDKKNVSIKDKNTVQDKIAIIGMACIFPNARDLDEYWRSICLGEDGITDIPPTHWSPEDYYDKDPKRPDHTYCKRGGFIPEIPYDPTEFGIPPNILEATDTSQLLGLLTAKKALKDAGYENKNFDRDRVSVILGVTGTQELVIPLGARLGHPIWRRALNDAGVNPDQAEEVVKRISDSYVSWHENSFPGLLGNVVAGRIANRLNLGGTNCVVDAACASSMSAIHLAMMELNTSKADMVITGGVDTLNDIFMYMCFSRTPAISPTGDARPFSKDADGTVLGEGIGMMVLKRLDDAIRDNDRIYSIIRTIGTSSDGKSQSIYAPHPDGQAKSLRRAYAQAGIKPSDIELVEAHGTGTTVGDFAEFTALNKVYREDSEQNKWCALGSVKSQIGHTKAAAGAASIIKAAMSLYHKIIPPTLKSEPSNPKLNIEDSPFYLNTKTRPWISQKKHPRFSGVSSFGFGGSNFHTVLEEYQEEKKETVWNGFVEILALSASSSQNLTSLLNVWMSSINGDMAFKEISRKAAVSRSRFSHKDKHRLCIVLEKSTDIKSILSLAKNKVQNKNIYYASGENPGKTAFLFSGQGSQYVNMGCDLVSFFPEAFKAVSEADIKIEEKWLSDYIYPQPVYDDEIKKKQKQELTQTQIAQPAIGAISMAMLRILERFGIKPDATAGHSYGELTALCAAGWIDTSTLHKLSEARGKFLAEAGAGGNNGTMLAVSAPLEELESMIAKECSDVLLANLNSPEQGVLSGAWDCIEKADKCCKARGYKTTLLSVSAAFHSSMVKNAYEPFKKLLNEVEFNIGDIIVFSNITGKPYLKDPKIARELLGKQLISPVNFVDEINNLYNMGIRTFIEVGPRSVITGLVKAILKGRNFHAISTDSSNGRESGIIDLARVLAYQAALGYPVKLSQWEKAISRPEKQRMTIPIVGSNYRLESFKVKAKSLEPKVSGFESKVPIYKAKQETQNPEVETQNPKPETQTGNPKTRNKKMTNPKEKHIKTNFNLITDAFKVVQEGLRSMQSLQDQTARVHEKFLETQKQASLNLQEMMLHTKHIADTAMGNKIYALPNINSLADKQIVQEKIISEKRAEIPLQEQVAESIDFKPESTKPGLPESIQRQKLDIAPSLQEEVKKIQDQPVTSQPEDFRRDKSEIEDIILGIVNELTGYPIEMLELNMDIESDLGIDSIKRVEILSNLEEKMPELPSIGPEMMGTLKTLGDIVDYLNSEPQIGVEASPNLPNSEPQAIVEASPNLPNSKDQAVIGASPNLLSKSDNAGRQETESIILEIVNELTGYPIEMLELDMDIEADLGIDSIKRVEILSALEERMPHLPSIGPEMMGSLKTLGQIVEYLNVSTQVQPETLKQEAKIPKPEFQTPKSEVQTPNPELQIPKPEPLSPKPEPEILNQELRTPKLTHRIITPVEQAYVETKQVNIPYGFEVWVTDDGTPLGEIIVNELKVRGMYASLISQKNFKTKEGHVGGLVILSEQTKTSQTSTWSPKKEENLKKAFELTHHVASNLIDAAKIEGAFFATVTRLDGAFGFIDKIEEPIQGGLAGLVKTASHEWNGVCCHAIDIAPDWQDYQMIARTIVREILSDGNVEVCLNNAKRSILDMQESPCAEGNMLLEKGDVVVISGGARGITAAAALALAREIQPTLILLGRSAKPMTEPGWLAGLENEADIKKALLTHAFARQFNTSPAQLQTVYKKYMASREITQNMEKMKQAGAIVQYYSVDVKDKAAIQDVLYELRSEYGPVKALIHGAGVLQDRFIQDKTREQVDLVFDTKVKGLRNLLEATKYDDLKYLILFSSVTARFGNKGQADYAMANEVLNKVARKQADINPDCRVISINWGPWEGGMVSLSLKKEFARQGIALIPIDKGADALIKEMKRQNHKPVEVVIGSTFELPDKSDQSTQNTEDTEISISTPESEIQTESNPKKKLSLSFSQDVNLETYPILKSHVIDSKPVVPFAIIAEWLGHSALHENPGLILQGFDNLRILSGIRLEENSAGINIMAGKLKTKNSVYEVNVEVIDSTKNDSKSIIHSQAKAILTEQLAESPAFNHSTASIIESKPYVRSVEDAYKDILFHGSQLHGIKEITGCSKEGMTAKLASAPEPADWLKDPFRSSWIGDPLIMDAAFQMASLWCYEEKQMVSLPIYIEKYRQYRTDFPSNGVKAILEIKEITDRRMKGDFTFLDAVNTVIADIKSYEAVMDPSLYDAFKRSFIK